MGDPEKACDPPAGKVWPTPRDLTGGRPLSPQTYALGSVAAWTLLPGVMTGSLYFAPILAVNSLLLCGLTFACGPLVRRFWFSVGLLAPLIGAATFAAYGLAMRLATPRPDGTPASFGDALNDASWVLMVVPLLPLLCPLGVLTLGAFVVATGSEAEVFGRPVRKDRSEVEP